MPFTPARPANDLLAPPVQADIGEEFGLPTMSSREIADLTGSSHDNVLKTVRGLINKGVVSGNETPYVHPQNGQTYQEFGLDFRNTMIVVSGYSPELRARIIDRWVELEKSQSRSLSPAEALIAHGKAMLAIEQRQAALAVKQAETERRLNQIETATDWFTCVGYARWTKQTNVDLKTAADLGRRASRRCKALGIECPKIPDPRFGAVSQYPKEILDAAWEEVFGRAA